jgi:hypothetical protein
VQLAPNSRASDATGLLVAVALPNLLWFWIGLLHLTWRPPNSR